MWSVQNSSSAGRCCYSTYVPFSEKKQNIFFRGSLYKKILNINTYMILPHKIRDWLVVSTPLKNISQLGLWFPRYGKIKFMIQTTNQGKFYHPYYLCEWFLVDRGEVMAHRRSTLPPSIPCWVAAATAALADAHVAASSGSQDGLGNKWVLHGDILYL